MEIDQTGRSEATLPRSFESSRAGEHVVVRLFRSVSPCGNVAVEGRRAAKHSVKVFDGSSIPLRQIAVESFLIYKRFAHVCNLGDVPHGHDTKFRLLGKLVAVTFHWIFVQARFNG